MYEGLTSTLKNWSKRRQIASITGLNVKKESFSRSLFVRSSFSGSSLSRSSFSRSSISRSSFSRSSLSRSSFSRSSFSRHPAGPVSRAGVSLCLLIANEMPSSNAFYKRSSFVGT